MSGNQMFTIIISFILVFFASSIFDTWSKYKSEVGRIKSQQELNRIVDERLKKLIEAEEASLKATDTVSKRLIELQEEIKDLSAIINDKLETKEQK
jgi:hypothetical protein